MDDMDRLLHDAGERWRASQPPPPRIDPASLERPRPRSSLPAVAAAAAGVAAALLYLVVVIAPPAPLPGAGWQATASPRRQDCPVTRPNPPFVAPWPYLTSPPANYGSAWFGSARLWTMLNHEGEVWANLPKGPEGFGQKTFWWSADWRPREEPEPAITVTGSRLDGPGTFSYAGGTNASADFGVAMLVGVDIPTAGCWRISGSYRDASLSYVVRVDAD